MKSLVWITLFLFCGHELVRAQTVDIQLYYGQEPHDVRSIRYSRPLLVHLGDFLRALDIEPTSVTDREITLEVNRRGLLIDTARKKARYNRRETDFPIRRFEEEIFVRVDNLIEIFTYLLGRDLIYESTSKTIHVPRSKDLVVRARTRRIEDQYRIILDYSYALDKPDHRESRDKLIVKLAVPSIVLDRADFVPNEAVAAMDVFQNLPDGSTEIVFTLRPATEKTVVERYNPGNPRTVFKLTGAFEDHAETLEPEARAGIRRIVIDPGHGGKDHGARGPTGLLEKDVTLALAELLRDELSADYEVLLTREEDIKLSLEARTGIANNFGADLFISIHVNAIASQNATGSETYYLSRDDVDGLDLSHYNGEPDTDEETGGAAGEDDLTLMLWDMAQSKHIEDSFRIARYIQESLNLLSGIKSRGVKQLPLKVLRGATMPAVLIEVAFISNALEEKKLKSIPFRERATRSIAAAVRRFDEDVKIRARGKLELGDEAEEGRR